MVLHSVDAVLLRGAGAWCIAQILLKSRFLKLTLLHIAWWQVVRMADELNQQQHCAIAWSLHCTHAVLPRGVLKERARSSELAQVS